MGRTPCGPRPLCSRVHRIVWTEFPQISSSRSKDRTRATRLFPSVHRVIALLKRWLGATHQGRVEPAHLQAYLDEFTFRFNRRKSRHVGKIFFRLVQQGAATAPSPYRELISQPRRKRRKR